MANKLSSGNRYVVCQYKEQIATIGVWLNRNPLDYSVSLLLLQLVLVSLVSQLIDLFLRPLGQSSIVAQILGGILFGPSLLGHKDVIGTTLFPPRGAVTFETMAIIGVMYFLFSIGVKSDSRMMVRPTKQAAITGTSTMFFSFVLTVPLAIVLKSHLPMDATLSSCLPIIAAFQCLIPFPNVSFLLKELQMSNTDLGQRATSACLMCDMIGMGLTATLLTILQNLQDPLNGLFTYSSTLGYVLVVVFIVRPLVMKALRKIPSGKGVGEYFIIGSFTGVLIAGIISEIVGQHFVFGPLVFGYAIPDGPPLGAALISKLDYPVGKWLYPTFLTSSGLKTNIFKINLRSLLIVFFVVFFSCLCKVGAVVLSSLYLKNLRTHDAVVLGLMMNAKGICELVVYNIWRDNKVLTDQEFALCILSLVAVTAIITPLIKFMYDPSKVRGPFKRRTIQHAKRDSELRILVCIQNQDSVPTIVNILQASGATEESPIAVIAVILVEIVGRYTPVLVSHQSARTLQPNDSRSSHVVNALRHYELCNESCVTVQSFSAISHPHMMHEDVCRVALDQNTNFVILPFHKRWEIDGSIGSVNRQTQNMNLKVLDKVCCSVGILVDRGVLTGSLSILNNQSIIYRVAVIYIGGPDDAESLCYGARMGRNDNVCLTLVRYLLFGCDTARERKQDNLLVEEVRRANMGNPNFIYQEQLVKDGVGLTASLRGLENNFDLLIAGRSHPTSETLTGLGTWSECPELGVVGDILASPDFGSTASLLVVQQQKMRGAELKNRLTKPVIASQESGPDTSHRMGAAPKTVAPAASNDESRLEIAIDRERI